MYDHILQSLRGLPSNLDLQDIKAKMEFIFLITLFIYLSPLYVILFMMILKVSVLAWSFSISFRVQNLHQLTIFIFRYFLRRRLVRQGHQHQLEVVYFYNFYLCCYLYCLDCLFDFCLDLQIFNYVNDDHDYHDGHDDPDDAINTLNPQYQMVFIPYYVDYLFVLHPFFLDHLVDYVYNLYDLDHMDVALYALYVIDAIYVLYDLCDLYFIYFLESIFVLYHPFYLNFMDFLIFCLYYLYYPWFLCNLDCLFDHLFDLYNLCFLFLQVIVLFLSLDYFCDLYGLYDFDFLLVNWNFPPSTSFQLYHYPIYLIFFFYDGHDLGDINFFNYWAIQHAFIFFT